MISIDFIIERLKQLSEKFIGIKLRYEFRRSTQSHLVEILPLDIFEEDELYLDEEIKLEAEFEKLYPSESIVFISEGSLTEIRNPEFEIGYSNFEFDIDIPTTSFSVDAYSVVVDNTGCQNYALAA